MFKEGGSGKKGSTFPVIYLFRRPVMPKHENKTDLRLLMRALVAIT